MRGFDLINVMLPDEIMVEIFRSLESNENREAASLVCKRWLRLARLNRETIHIGFSASTDALVERLIDRFVNVRDVFIEESPFTSLALKMGRAALLNLFGNSIDVIRNCCLSDSGLAAVGDGFTKLESLKLICCSNITDVGLISIGEKCKLLKSLEIQECRIEGGCLAAIGKYCTRLEDLNFRRCKRLNDNGLVQLAFGCGRTLKSLGLVACPRLTDTSLVAVGYHCRSLESLYLNSKCIRRKGLVSVAKGCPLLKSLKLDCENIEDKALEAVGSFCSVLELLSLYRCGKLTDKSLCAIGKGCKKLKNLSLRDCNSMSDMGLDSIAVGCEELMHLEVNKCENIRTGGLISIGKSCTRLSELALLHWQFLQIENDALHEFGIGCKYLQSLHLRSCSSIGDEALCAIARGCKNLKKLNIHNCHLVGNEGIISVGQNCKFLADLIIRDCDGVGEAGIIAIARGCPLLNYLDVGGLECSVRLKLCVGCKGNSQFVTKLTLVLRNPEDPIELQSQAHLRTLPDNLGDKGIMALSEGCPLLKDLAILKCPQITDVGVSYIAGNCVSLEACNMIYCPGISKAGVTTLITGCQKLKKLLVEGEKVSQRTKRRAACLLVGRRHGDLLFFRDF